MTQNTLIVPADWQILNDNERRRFFADEYGEADSGSNILAVAKPKAGKEGVFALLATLPVGYIDAAGGHIDVAAVKSKAEEDLLILNQENGLQGADEIRFKKFAPPPSYDSAHHTVSYGIELAFGRTPALNLYRIQLVRDGALVLTLVGTPADKLSLDGFAIEPESDKRYDAFNPNTDRRSESSLTNLLMMNRFV
ncbi:MAG: DUF2167 domain-containing protein [Cardiobacteriaceae bacterium]|nr:DUF2167 domain-containing protein [Cardiobacteriaceae bacterium]